MTRTEVIDDIMSKVSVIATKRVRRYACMRPGYTGNETEVGLTVQIEKLTNELRKTLEGVIDGAEFRSEA